MQKMVILWLCALAPLALEAEEVPEHYKGTWILDKAASASNLATWSGPSDEKKRFADELERMPDPSLTITADQLIFEQNGRKDSENVRVASLTDDALVLEDLAGRGQFTFRVTEDETLVMESGVQPPMVFSRADKGDGPEAAAESSGDSP